MVIKLTNVSKVIKKAKVLDNVNLDSAFASWSGQEVSFMPQ